MRVTVLCKSSNSYRMVFAWIPAFTGMTQNIPSLVLPRKVERVRVRAAVLRRSASYLQTVFAWIPAFAGTTVVGTETKKGRSIDRPFGLLGLDYVILSISGVISRNTGANTRDTMAINFKRMFKDGPEVSLKGSPTTSPSTAALWASEPLPP